MSGRSALVIDGARTHPEVVIGVARLDRVGTAVVCAALLAVGCGGDDARTGESSVTSEVVSDATTQDVHVFAPQGSRTSPVVVALHGIDGSGEDMGEVATRLAGAGMVVFAPSYRSSDLATPEANGREIVGVEANVPNLDVAKILSN